MNVVTLPVSWLDAAVTKLTCRPDRVAVCAAGQYVRENVLELLCRTPPRPVRIGRVRRAVTGVAAAVIMTRRNGGPDAAQTRQILEAVRAAQTERTAYLNMRLTKDSLQFEGWLLNYDTFLAIDALNLPGPGLQTLRVRPIWPLPKKASGRPANSPAGQRPPPDPVEPDSRARLDRLRTFLGRGDASVGDQILERAADLRVGVVGCSRSGSWVVYELVKSGVSRRGEIFAIDGDVVEWPNLDVMPVPPRSVGMPKPEAVARMATAFVPESRVVPVYANLASPAAIEAAISCDVIFTCVDHDSARIGAAALAARYHRVHFDLSGGGAYDAGGHPYIGGEVRLFVPGTPGCTGCMGRRDWLAAKGELLRTPEERRQRRSAADGGRERPGSCGSILHSVVGTGLHTFWELLRETQRTSRWFHLDANEALPVWRDRTPAGRRSCQICSPDGLTGLGDWRD